YMKNFVMRFSVRRLKGRLLALLLCSAQGLFCAAAMPHFDKIDGWGNLNYDLNLGSNSLRCSQVVQIAAGSFHNLALEGNGKVLAWGDNQFGQTNIPVRVKRGFAIQIVAGNVHSIALMGDRTVTCWGPTAGQLGGY